MKTTATALSYLFLALLMGCMASHDPIKMLLKKLNATDGMWVNGKFNDISLPKNAEPEEVIAQAIKNERIETYELREMRKVEINVSAGMIKPFTAVLVDSNLGTKILLFSYELNELWWSRWYDIPENKPNQ